MLYVISTTENLVETLRLAVQCEDGTMAAESTPVTTAQALFADVLDECCDAGDARAWIVLVGKREWEPAALDSIANVIRILITQPAEKNNGKADNEAMAAHRRGGGIFVVKREPSDDDAQRLTDHVAAVRREWHAEWNAVVEKYSRLGESRARSEYLMKVNRWLNETDAPLEADFCELAYMDDEQLLPRIRKFFGLDACARIEIVDAKEADEEDARRQRTPVNNFFTKPPALHWTSYPRDAELQVSFKFTFSSGTVTAPRFRRWTRCARRCLSWEYVYEWPQGLLLRQRLVKVTLLRGPANVIDVSGRIDRDEADAEEEEEDEEAEAGDDADYERRQIRGAGGGRRRRRAPTLAKVWPYFAKVFHSLLAAIDGNETGDDAKERGEGGGTSYAECGRLPYTVNLVFIGAAFFTRPPGATRRITSRSLDAVQTLGAIQRAGAVRFKVADASSTACNNVVYALSLDEAFPAFRPTRLEDIRPDVVGSVPTVTDDNSAILDSVMPSATIFIQNDNEAANECAEAAPSPPSGMPPFESQREDSFVMGDGGGGIPPSFQSHFGASGAQNNNTLTATDRRLSAVHKNRGRRVSFGAIRAIPPSLIGVGGGDASGGGLAGPSVSAHTSPLLPLRVSNSSHRLQFTSTSGTLPEKTTIKVEDNKSLIKSTTTLDDDIVEQQLNNNNNNIDKQQYRQQRFSIGGRPIQWPATVSIRPREEETSSSSEEDESCNDCGSGGGGGRTTGNEADYGVVQTYAVVNEYVDRMLQKAMDEALID